MTKDTKTVTMTKKEFDELTRDSTKLECLIAAGVDNWEGYPDAMDMFRTAMEELGLEK